MMAKGLDSKPRVVYEVEKVIGVSSDGNVRTYQVQWAPSWVSSFHLAGCEHLIHEFLQRQAGNTLQCQAGEINEEDADMRPCFTHTNQAMSESVVNHSLETKSSDNNCTETLSSLTHEGNECFVVQPVPNCLQSSSGETVSDILDPMQQSEVAMPEAAESQENYEASNSAENVVYRIKDNSDTITIKIEEEEDEESATADTSAAAGLPHSDTLAMSFPLAHKHTMSENELVGTSHSPPWYEGHNSSDSSATMAKIPTYTNHSYWHDTYGPSDNLAISDNFQISPDGTSFKHTKQKDHICSLCGKQFISRSHLNVHSRTHSGVKPYPCEHCDRAFIQSSDLKRHLLTHTGERPFVCDICGKTFTRNNNLKHHLITHQKFQ